MIGILTEKVSLDTEPHIKGRQKPREMPIYWPKRGPWNRASLTALLTEGTKPAHSSFTEFELQEL